MKRFFTLKWAVALAISAVLLVILAAGVLSFLEPPEEPFSERMWLIETRPWLVLWTLCFPATLVWFAIKRRWNQAVTTALIGLVMLFFIAMLRNMQMVDGHWQLY